MIKENPFTGFAEDEKLKRILGIVEEDRSKEGQSLPDLDAPLFTDEKELKVVEMYDSETGTSRLVYSEDGEIQQIKPPRLTTCGQFEPYEVVAESFINRLVKDVQIEEESSSSSSSSTSSSDDKQETKATTEWPTIEEFTKELGLWAIENYISNVWKPDGEWHRTIYLILEQSDRCADYYTYQTIWSLPNKEYPVAQVYACIYFVVRVSRIKPVNCRVDVCYYYEGCTNHFGPETDFLNEDYLFKILTSKLNLYRSLRF